MKGQSSTTPGRPCGEWPAARQRRPAEPLQGPAGIDWLCVSPKAGAPLAVTQGQELKLVFPQAGLDPAALQALAFDHFLLQPMDGPDRARNTTLAVDYCLAHPAWRLSVQTHKMVGIR